MERTGSSVRWCTPGDRSTAILLASQSTEEAEAGRLPSLTEDGDSVWAQQATLNTQAWHTYYDREASSQAAPTAASNL